MWKIFQIFPGQTSFGPLSIPVIGLGAGGHAKVVIEILRLDHRYQLIGLLDSKPELAGQTVLDLPILGDDTHLSHLIDEGVRYFFVGLGSTGNVTPRRRLYELARSYEMEPVSAVHPQAIISPSAAIGEGVTIMAQAVINACASLGANVIINTGAIVEHDCILADHVHVATGARLTSTIRVGTGAHIGAGATVKQGVTIGENAIVGAGAVVVKDIPANTVVVGVPAQVLYERTGSQA